MSKSKSTDSDSKPIARKNPHTQGSITVSIDAMLHMRELKERFFALKKFSGMVTNAVENAWTIAYGLGGNAGDFAQLEFWIIEEESK